MWEVVVHYIALVVLGLKAEGGRELPAHGSARLNPLPAFCKGKGSVFCHFFKKMIQKNATLEGLIINKLSNSRLSVNSSWGCSAPLR